MAAPMFLNTVEGKNYLRVQTERLHDLDEGMRDVERELEETAEALDHSHATIAALRHQIGVELGAQNPDRVDDPVNAKQT